MVVAVIVVVIVVISSNNGDSMIPFPPPKVKSQLFSLFLINETNRIKNIASVNYSYHSTAVVGFESQPCLTSQPDGLCRRVNLFSTYTNVITDGKYSLIELATLVASAILSVQRCGRPLVGG